ncbi:MAG: 50S ribosomal protein L10 [Candidatus Dadabacteria bacterium]|nr:50S ribosomal protein L10 [Candidatus Dadabacteria bacterium]
MLTKAGKEQIVKGYNERFKGSPSLFVLEYKGLTVKEIEGLRRSLKKAKAELKVAKNTLLKLASLDTDIEKIKDMFDGSTAVAICKDDPIAVAKVFSESLKSLRPLKLKGGIVEGRVIEGPDVSKLSQLPSRPVLVAEFLGLISSPLSNLMGTLMELERKLLHALSALKDLKEKKGEA